MAWVDVGARYGLRCCLLALAAIAAALTFSGDAADARHHRSFHVHATYHAHYTHYAHSGRGHRHARVEEEYSPPYASIVVDGNSGAVLQASNPDAARHPASLTKVMTLYLLFERLDAGKINLDTPLKVSQHAADQDPTKLELKAGQFITVEDAIKGIVTKSANDAAVTIAENLGGDENSFAKMMTQKARALGMSRTTYINASGLPDDDQITTARDQALLGRAIQDRFPRYYKYFSTTSFVFHGETIRGHNHLLGSVDGVDGIKTGFTRASGFNLLTSVHRDSRYIVAVVLGGPSSSERDDRMRDLISGHIKEAAVRRTAPLIADAGDHRDDAQPLAFAKTSMVSHAEPAQPAARADTAPTATASVDAHVASAADDPIRPLIVRTISYRTAPVQTASLAPMPALVPVAAPVAAPVPSPAVVATPQPAAAAPTARAQAPVQAVAPLPAVQTVAQMKAPEQVPAAKPIAAETAAPQPAEPVKVQPAQIVPVQATPVPAAAQIAPGRAASAQAAPVQVAPMQAEPANTEVADADVSPVEPMTAPAVVHAHSGWLIQIGAFDDEDQAKQHLSAAQVKVHAALAAKDPFTERVQKGDKALYRARFAGFDKTTAEAACKQLKRSDIECMALKD